MPSILATKTWEEINKWSPFDQKIRHREERKVTTTRQRLGQQLAPGIPQICRNYALGAIINGVTIIIHVHDNVYIPF
jgi:hypothetical protein